METVFNFWGSLYPQDEPSSTTNPSSLAKRSNSGSNGVLGSSSSAAAGSTSHTTSTSSVGGGTTLHKAESTTMLCEDLSNNPEVTTMLCDDVIITDIKEVSNPELTVKDLLLFTQLFYLPSEHGQVGLELLNDFFWLKKNAVTMLPPGAFSTSEAGC